MLVMILSMQSVFIIIVNLFFFFNLTVADFPAALCHYSDFSLPFAFYLVLQSGKWLHRKNFVLYLIKYKIMLFYLQLEVDQCTFLVWLILTHF